MYSPGSVATVTPSGPNRRAMIPDHAARSSGSSAGRNGTPSPPPVLTSTIGHPASTNVAVASAILRITSSTMSSESLKYR
jgi:hypothetical protein